MQRPFVMVTGGNRGIGLWTCIRLMREYNARVVLCARSKANATKAAEQALREAGVAGDVAVAPHPIGDSAVLALELDVTSSESVAQAWTAFTASVGGSEDSAASVLDALVNNAGVCMDAPWQSLAGLPRDRAAAVARDTLAVNFDGVLRVCDTFVPALKPGGRVVMVSSGAGPANMKKMSARNRGSLLHLLLERPGQDVRRPLSAEDLKQFAAGFTEAFENAVVNSALPCLVLPQDDSAVLEFSSQPAEAPSDCEADRTNASLMTEGSSYLYGWWLQAYGFSKALLNAYTRLLSASNQGKFVVNACTPGFVGTDMTADCDDPSMPPPKTPFDGADTPCWLALGEHDHTAVFVRGRDVEPWVAK